MTISDDLSSDPCDGLGIFGLYGDAASPVSCWRGRDIAWEHLPELCLDVQRRIMELLSQGDHESELLMYQLAWLGASPEKRSIIERDIAYLIQTADEWKIIPIGGVKHAAKRFSGGCKQAWDKTCNIAEKTCEVVGEFWENHNTEILVGAALCATGVGIAYVTGYTLSVSAAGVVVAGAGAIFSKSDDRPNPHIPHCAPPCSKEDFAAVQQMLPSSLLNPELPSATDQLFITSKGIWINGQFTSHEDLQSSLFAEKLIYFKASSIYQMPLQSRESVPIDLNIPASPLPEITPPPPLLSHSKPWLLQGAETVGRLHIDPDVLDFNAPLPAALDRSRHFEIAGTKSLRWTQLAGQPFR